MQCQVGFDETLNYTLRFVITEFQVFFNWLWINPISTPFGIVIQCFVTFYNHAHVRILYFSFSQFWYFCGYINFQCIIMVRLATHNLSTTESRLSHCWIVPQANPLRLAKCQRMSAERQWRWRQSPDGAMLAIVWPSCPYCIHCLS